MAESTGGTSELLEIVVRGNARDSYTPERALLSLSAGFSGPNRETVYTDAVGVQRRIVDSLTALDEQGAVSTWHSESVHVWSYRPVDNEGNPREPLYTTRIQIHAEFVDFDELNAFIDAWAAGRRGWPCRVGRHRRRTTRARARPAPPGGRRCCGQGPGLLRRGGSGTGPGHPACRSRHARHRTAGQEHADDGYGRTRRRVDVGAAARGYPDRRRRRRPIRRGVGAGPPRSCQPQTALYDAAEKAI